MITGQPRLAPIGGLIDKVASWNPVRDAPEDELPYIDLSAVDNAAKTVTSIQTVQGRDAPSRARQLVKSGDILVSTVRPNLNGVARVPEKLDGATASTGFCVLRPKPSKLDGGYLFHWVRSSEFVGDMVRKATGASYPAVSDKIIGQSEIPLPPLEEQKRIAAILDQADELRSKRGRALDRLGQLGQAIFYEMFGDPISPDADKAERLAEIAELINGDRSSNYPSGDDIKDSGVLFLNTTNIQDGELNFSKAQFITPEKFASLSRGKLVRGDLVITLRGTLGQCALFDCEHETGFINAQMMIIRCREGVLPRYLKEYISFPSIQIKLNSSNSGSAVPQLTATQMKELQVIVPSRAEQLAFVAAVDAARQVIGAQSAHANNLGRLFASLQHRAFRGEL